MCGHDWCSVRISKEILELASGKAEGFERERVQRSAALTPAQQAILEARGNLGPEELLRLASKTRFAVGAHEERGACHSDQTAEEEARRIQEQRLVDSAAAPPGRP